MVLLNGHVSRLQGASPDLPLPFNLMAVCSVLPTMHSLRKSAGQNATVRFACSMQPASLIAAAVRCVRSVRKVFPPCPPRRVSAVFWPVTARCVSATLPCLPEPPPKTPEPVPCFPVLWGDWPRCQIRRNWLKVVRCETMEVTMGMTPAKEPRALPTKHVMTRAQRAHWRLNWQERLARNARPSTAPPLTLTLHGLPATFAHVYGFALLEAA